jgi:signal transduction histidine kinase
MRTEYTEGTTRVRRLERLLEASLLLNSTLQLSELTEIVLRIVKDEVPVDRCTLFVLDRKQNLLRSFVAQGIEEFEIELPVGEGLAGTVALNGQPLDVEDAYEDRRFQAYFDGHLGYRTQDALCMPILNFQGALTGVLQLLNRVRPLNAGDKQFLSSMCAYIGVALQNAWTHHELLESRKAEEELRLVRERLAQADKRSAMSELAAGIIHEMRNPLSIAMGQCALFREEEPMSAVDANRVQKIETSISRALKVAKNFLSFARHGGNERAPVDLNGIVNQTMELLAYDFRHRNLRVDLALQSVPLVRLDPGSIQQVLLNLLKNAMQAAGESRNGTISLRSLYDPHKRVVSIELHDNGPGIPEDVQSRVFEPFFTTKPAGAGTGLGLVISKRIVEEHRGTLSFESAAGRGTTFRIELPLE